MKERRIDLRPWQNLDQLKEAYEKYISPNKIDTTTKRYRNMVDSADYFNTNTGQSICTCGNCGDVLIVIPNEISSPSLCEDEYTCPYCNVTMELCDFPDLFI